MIIKEDKMFWIFLLMGLGIMAMSFIFLSFEIPDVITTADFLFFTVEISSAELIVLNKYLPFAICFMTGFLFTLLVSLLKLSINKK